MLFLLPLVLFFLLLQLQFFFFQPPKLPSRLILFSIWLLLRISFSQLLPSLPFPFSIWLLLLIIFSFLRLLIFLFISFLLLLFSFYLILLSFFKLLLPFSFSFLDLLPSFLPQLVPKSWLVFIQLSFLISYVEYPFYSKSLNLKDQHMFTISKLVPFVSLDDQSHLIYL